MDFEFSEDQAALRAGARDLLDDLAAPARVRAHVDGGAAYDRSLWSAMVEQGWPGIALAERDGGLGLGAVEVAILLEEAGAHAAPAPFGPAVLAAGALAAAGEAAWVERILAGEAVACVAGCARAGGVRAEERAGAWSLTGTPDPVPYAPSADVAVVSADRGLFAVDLCEAGRPQREPAMDVTRELGWLHLDGTPARRLGGEDARDALADAGAVHACAEMLGGARRVLDLAVDHARERVQFGRPIGSFQAVKHRCADMLVDVEGMHSTVYWAAWCLAAGDPDAAIAASTAKTWCADASKRVMASALQVHGGIGFTWEHDLHFFLKRAQLDQMLFGDATYHRDRLARLLRARVEVGGSVV